MTKTELQEARADFFEAVRKLRIFEKKHAAYLRDSREERIKLRSAVDDLYEAIEAQGGVN